MSTPLCASPTRRPRPFAGRIGSISRHAVPDDRRLGTHNMPHHGHARLHQHAQLVLPILLFSLLAPLASRPVLQSPVQQVDGHLIAGDFPAQAPAPDQHKGSSAFMTCLLLG